MSGDRHSYCDQLKQGLIEIDVELKVKVNEHMQNDLKLRKCLETKVDIFKG